MKIIDNSKGLNKLIVEFSEDVLNCHDKIIAINIALITKETPLYQMQGGVELLKYLRLSGCEKTCIMYSCQSIDELLQQKPQNIILLSKGVYVLNSTDFNKITLPKELEKADLSFDHLSPYIRADFVMPEQGRHDWANWWGAKIIYDIYYALYNAENNYTNKINDELKSIEVKKALYLFGNNIEKDIQKYLEKKEVNNKTIRENISEKIKSLKKRKIKILFIDDHIEDGWGDIFEKIITDNEVDYKEKNNNIIKISPIEGETKINIYNRIEEYIDDMDMVMLDLRILPDDNDRKSVDVKLMTGYWLLKKIREKYKSIPVLIITGSNKSWSYEELEKSGATSYWVKEGIDEKRNIIESINNFNFLIEIIEKQTSLIYDFIVEYEKSIRKLNNIYNNWWLEVNWCDMIGINSSSIIKIKDKKNINLTNTTVSENEKKEIYKILSEVLSIMIDYANKVKIKCNIQKSHEWIYLSSIISRLSIIIENVHGSVKIKGSWEYDVTANDMGSSPDDKFYQNDSRKDYLAQFMYKLRNKAAHKKYVVEFTDVNCIITFTVLLIVWLYGKNNQCLIVKYKNKYDFDDDYDQFDGDPNKWNEFMKKFIEKNNNIISSAVDLFPKTCHLIFKEEIINKLNKSHVETQKKEIDDLKKEENKQVHKKPVSERRNILENKNCTIANEDELSK
ncbi:MAG: response regulator, partial [Bacteroidetes bacterium]|nr:response regulator [Bacteroidota bacterium]